MERCPNCGSTVRAGAKFCTTCGMRLPEAPVVDESAPAAGGSGSGKGSPFDSTASVSGSRWPSSTSGAGSNDAATGYAVSDTGAGSTAEAAAPETANEEQNAEAAPPPAEESGPAWASASSSSGWNWGGQPSGEESDQDQTAEAVVDSAVAPATTAESTEPATAGSDETATASETVDTETAVQVADTGPTETGIIEETVYEAPESAVVSTAPAETPLQEPTEEAEPEETGAAGEQYAPFATAGSAGTPAATGTSDDLDRANHLLDELRSLLPQLASTGQATAGIDIAATLKSATASEEQRASFEDLRSAVNAAQQRPRDIDTMLDISNRLDVIASLEDAYQKLSSAVDAVVSQLSDEEA